ncbi:MAG: class I SAM-dependent methyltransferase [Novosphingobium sp.]|nr:class I SAM-dependent methyltransferase [Novosphingobium sp.]
MEILISYDVFENKIQLNNINNIKFNGDILIKYYNKIVYSKNLILDDYALLWFMPNIKMTNIENIKVDFIDNGNIIYSYKPLIYTSFMRGNDIELNNVCKYIKDNNSDIKNIIEIGSYQGESTLIFNKNFKDSKIFAVDMWEPNYDHREININTYNMLDIENNFNVLTKNIDNIIKIKMSSVDFSKLIADKSIDFIYIDANHLYNYVNDDILYWKNKVKNGGFISGHDYNNFNKDDVVKAVNEHFDINKIKIIGDTWIVKNN